MPMNVRTLCLAILFEEPASGYEIRKLSMDNTCKFSHFIDVSYGAIYPALGKLEEEGLIAGHVVEQENKPAKRVYEITDKGRSEFLASIAVVPEDDKFKSEFLLLAMHCDMLPRAVIRKAIEVRMATLRAKVNSIEECDLCALTPGARFVFAYGLLMNRASLKYLEENHQTLIDAAGTNLQAEAAE